MATRNCPIGADGIVQKRPRTVVTPIRRHPSIRRALPITAGRHTGGHEVAMSRPGPGDHALPLRQRSVHRWAEEHHAGILDECVEMAELGDRVLDRP